MRVTLVPSSFSTSGAINPSQYLISYLINDLIAIDAGGLGLYGSPVEQARIRHVLISHSHIDHTASLPIFLENAFEAKAECVVVHGSPTVLDSLQTDMFNDRTWPDFVALTSGGMPFLKFETLEALRPLVVDGLTITPVPVDHVVPTFGFLIADSSSTVVIASDTAPTQALWDAANAAPRLSAVFLEASFPNSMAELARISKHLTPAQFGEEVRKLDRPVPVIALHLKARYRDVIMAELEALGLPNVEIGRFGVPYDL